MREILEREGIVKTQNNRRESKKAIPEDIRLELLSRNESFRQKLEELRNLRDSDGPESKEYIRLMMEIEDDSGLARPADSLLDKSRFKEKLTFPFPVRIILQDKLHSSENPINGHYCRDCGSEFTVKLVKTKEGVFRPAAGEVKCPGCGSQRTSIKRRLFSKAVEVKDNFLQVQIDTRHTIEEIVRDLKEVFRELRKKGVLPKAGIRRKWLRNYKPYIDVWDLRQKGLTADQIAPKLWPKEYKKLGGRDTRYGEKGPLIQRVSDYQKAAQKLIDHSFPLQERHAPQFKK